MSAEIINLFKRKKEPKTIIYYELYWMKCHKKTCISSHDPDRIKRQMVSLANQQITASLNANGFPFGFVSSNPNGQFDVVFNQYAGV